MRKPLVASLSLIASLSFLLIPAHSQGLSGVPMLQEPAGRPRVLKFYANWCRPCQMMKPIIEKVARRFRNKVDVVEIDVDVPENRKLMKAYGVTKLPSMIFQTGSGEQFMTIGEQSEREVVNDMRQIAR